MLPDYIQAVSQGVGHLLEARSVPEQAGIKSMAVSANLVTCGEYLRFFQKSVRDYLVRFQISRWLKVLCRI